MAVSNVNVGLGVGMSGETTVPDQLFRAQQQRDITGAKAAQKKAEEEEKELDAVKRKVLVGSDKVHRLESKKVTDEMAKTILRINEVRKTNPNDYLNETYKIFSEYQNTLNQSLTRSKNLFDFEEGMSSRNRNQYISSSAQTAKSLMNDSKTTEDWMSRLEKNNVPSTPYFSYDPSNAAFGFKVDAAFDPAKEVSDMYSKKSNQPIGLSKSIEKLSDGKKATKFVFKKGVPRTQKEAQEIYDLEIQRRVKEGESVAGMPPPVSGEQIAMNFLSTPEKLDQYVDRYPETMNMSQTELVEHFLNNFYDPYSPYKEDTKFFKESKELVNVTIAGGDEPASEFLFVEDKGTFAGTDIPYEGLMAVSVGGKYKSNAILLNDVLDMSTGKEVNTVNVDVSKRDVTINFGQIYIVPVVKEGKTKRLATQAEISSKKVKPTYEVRQEVNFSGLEGLGPTIEAVTKSTTLWPVDKVKSMLYTQGLKEKQISSLNTQLTKAKKKASDLNRSTK
jgi:hypothetical protein